MKINSVDLFSRIPKNQLSQIVGKLVETKLPGPLAGASVKAFAKYYNINLSEAEKPVGEYRSIADLFTRRLKAGARPVQGSLVHPCDAVISESGFASDGILIQAKGLTYSLEALLADWELAERFRSGLYATYYLCPTDYHRVHSPVTGSVKKAIYVPGTLWPVNTWSVQRVRNLFAINE
ncbi:MAG: archaetidylserine decarboxylase, partial [Bdellovibrionales bacterium]|nr:archaetidylserine decarboxylase [Bdellovibrionales bacterium]